MPHIANPITTSPAIRFSAGLVLISLKFCRQKIQSERMMKYEFIFGIEFFVFFIFLFSIACYFPLLLQADGSHLNKPDHFPGYQRALQATAATISISIPLLFESLMDINLPKEITISRWMHILGLIIPNSVVMIYQLPLVYVCSALVRVSMLVGSLMIHMFNDPILFTKSRKVKYLLSYFSFQLCLQYRLYRMCYPEAELWKVINPIGGPIVAIIGILGILLYIATVLRFLVIDKAYHGGEKYCVYYSIGGVVAVFVFATYAIVSVGQGNERNYLSGYQLVATLLAEAALSVFATVIPTRIARHDRDQAEVSSPS
jgi:hypothetical protein